MSLRARALSALRWTAFSQLSTKLLTWAVTLYVIRILRPADYGLMAISAAVIELTFLFNDLGLNAALIQKRRLSEPTVRKIFTAVLLCNGMLFLVIQALAAPIASFYGDPSLVNILRVLSFGPLIDAFASVPTALLLREIEFRAVAVIEMLRHGTSSLMVLALALAGWGVWSLVAGSLWGTCVNAVGILIVTRYRVRLALDLSGLARELRFGATIVAKSIVAAFNQRVDALLIGRLLGVEQLGTYSVATDLARMPSRILLRPLTRVSFPTVARLQEEPERVKRMALSMVASILLILTPLLWGASVLAEQLVISILGKQWTGAIPILRIVCLVIPLRAVARSLQPILDGVGRPEIGLKNHITVGLCLVPGLVLGAAWGLAGVAAGWAAAHLLSIVLNLRRSLPVLGITGRALVATLAPTLACAALMLGSVALVKAAFPPDPFSIWQSLGLVGCGAAVYVAAILLFHRDAAFGTLRLVRG